MENSNEKPKKVFDYNSIKKDRLNETPDLNSFIDNPYSRDEVMRDLKKLESIKAKENHDDIGMRDADIHEYATQQEIVEMDWFHEDDRSELLFADDKGCYLSACLTSEYDDHLNHVDIVCVMNNSYTNFLPVPFALDLTYRCDADFDNSNKLDQKFSWRHRSKEINAKGFCEVKYFEDTDTFDKSQTISRGKIDAMPRFVVGYDEELANKITEDRMMSTGWGSLARIEPSSKAKFCVLSELVKQSGEMVEYLEEHHDTPKMLQLQSDVKALNEYFVGALEAAEEKDRVVGYESYVKKDETAQSILARKIVD